MGLLYDMDHIQDQLIHAKSHLSTYKFEPRLWALCLSLQSLPHCDDFQAVWEEKFSSEVDKRVCEPETIIKEKFPK